MKKVKKTSLGVIQNKYANFRNYDKYKSKYHTIGVIVDFCIVALLLTGYGVYTFGNDDTGIFATMIPILLAVVLFVLQFVIDIADNRVYINDKYIAIKNDGTTIKYELIYLSRCDISPNGTLTFFFINGERVDVRNIVAPETVGKKLQNVLTKAN